MAAAITRSPLAVITGAGSGIGAALTELLSWKGIRVLAVGRRLQPLQVGEDAGVLTSIILLIGDFSACLYDN